MRIKINAHQERCGEGDLHGYVEAERTSTAGHEEQHHEDFREQGQNG